ncbi:hypothetical protein AAKU67_002800 [Oxalobacteraceae bacterium GrIS 2.11]
MHSKCHIDMNYGVTTYFSAYLHEVTTVIYKFKNSNFQFEMLFFVILAGKILEGKQLISQQNLIYFEQ